MPKVLLYLEYDWRSITVCIISYAVPSTCTVTPSLSQVTVVGGEFWVRHSTLARKVVEALLQSLYFILYTDGAPEELSHWYSLNLRVQLTWHWRVNPYALFNSISFSISQFTSKYTPYTYRDHRSITWWRSTIQTNARVTMLFCVIRIARGGRISISIGVSEVTNCLWCWVRVAVQIHHSSGRAVITWWSDRSHYYNAIVFNWTSVKILTCLDIYSRTYNTQMINILCNDMHYTYRLVSFLCCYFQYCHCCQ